MITVQIKIADSIDKIWDLWTLPLHITKWNMASEDWHTPFAENDLKVEESLNRLWHPETEQ